MKTIKNLLKAMIKFFKNLFKKKVTLESEVKKITEDPEFLKLKKSIRGRILRRMKKAYRNGKKRYATTKSFNNNSFPKKKDTDIYQEKSAKQYMRLVQRKKLLSKKGIRNRILTGRSGKMMTYTEWVNKKYSRVSKVA